MADDLVTIVIFGIPGVDKGFAKEVLKRTKYRGSVYVLPTMEFNQFYDEHPKESDLD